jgi:hypothetical protein
MENVGIGLYILNLLLSNDSLTSGKENLGSHWLQSWVGPIKGLDTVEYLLHTRTVQLQKQPFLSNTRMQQWNNGIMQPASKQRLGKQHFRAEQCLAITLLVFLCDMRYATVELCFLRCPCRGYITRARFR